jgi:uncharacterized membrane protein YkgB
MYTIALGTMDTRRTVPITSASAWLFILIVGLWIALLVWCSRICDSIASMVPGEPLLSELKWMLARLEWK